MFPDKGSHETETTYMPTENDALRYAQKKIKEVLKSPSTAEFPNYREKQDHVTGYYPNFKINSWVDSQNSFGATLRTKYSCEVYYVDDKVGIKNLKID